MKKAIISFLFALSVAVSFGQQTTYQIYVINGNGYTKTYTAQTAPAYVFITPSVNNVTLTNDITFSFSTPPPIGFRITYYFTGTFNLNGHFISLNGDVVNDQDMVSTTATSRYDYIYYDGGWTRTYIPKLDFNNQLNGASIRNGTLPLSALEEAIPLSSLDTTGRGRILYGNATNETSTLFAGGNGKILIGDGTDINSVAVSGDVTLNSAGVISIASGAIVNADVNASAAIAMSKLAALTASKPVVTDGSGILTTTNQMPAAYGGTGIDASASTGFVKVSAGTFSVGSISETVQLQVSFEAGEVGDFKIKMPFAGTVTEIYSYATKVIAGTDNGTIVAKNNAGTTMTSGTITYTASDPRGTAYTVSPSANNTFVAGDILTFTTAKTTAGGIVQLSITVTRNN